MSALQNPAYEALYKFSHFNPIQTQVGGQCSAVYRQHSCEGKAAGSLARQGFAEPAQQLLVQTSAATAVASESPAFSALRLALPLLLPRPHLNSAGLPYSVPHRSPRAAGRPHRLRQDHQRRALHAALLQPVPGAEGALPCHGMQQADQGPAQHICPCTVSFLAATQLRWAPWTPCLAATRPPCLTAAPFTYAGHLRGAPQGPGA